MPESDAELVQQYLRDRDVPCPGCGYNLRSLMSDRCPECAEHLALQIGLLEPRVGTFVAGIIGLAIGIGFSALILGLVAVRMGGGRGWPPASIMLIPLIGVAVEGFALSIWLICRRDIRRAGRIGRGFLVLLCWLLTAIQFTLLATYVH